MRPLIIAIDGPSGAGKGTVARAVAAKLGYRHVDSGAMYRAVAWKALRDRLSLNLQGGGRSQKDAAQEDSAREDADADADDVASLAAASRIEVGPARVTIDGIDVTREIRTPEIDRAAAAVARLPKVRAVLVERQRRLGAGGGIVMEGRDIGTVVFPQADVKIYLDALPEERARRRANDPAHSGAPAAIAEVVTALAARDELDRTRAASPLTRARDAVCIDTTNKPVAQVVEEVMATLHHFLSL